MSEKKKPQPTNNEKPKGFATPPGFVKVEEKETKKGKLIQRWVPIRRNG